MEYLLFALKILVITFLFAVPGILIDSWLVTRGIVRGDKISLVIGIFCLVLIKMVWFQNTSWWIWGTAIVLGMIFAVHRGDLWATMKNGPWWWKTDRQINKKNQSTDD